MAMTVLNLFSQNYNSVKNLPWPLLTTEESLGINGAKGASYQLYNRDP